MAAGILPRAPAAPVIAQEAGGTSEKRSPKFFHVFQKFLLTNRSVFAIITERLRARAVITNRCKSSAGFYTLV